MCMYIVGGIESFGIQDVRNELHESILVTTLSYSTQLAAASIAFDLIPRSEYYGRSIYIFTDTSDRHFCCCKFRC